MPIVPEVGDVPAEVIAAAPIVERITNAFQSGVKTGIISSVPEGVSEKIITTVDLVTDSVPDVVNQAQLILKNSNEISERILLVVQSGVSAGNAGLAVGGGAIFIVSGKNYLKASNKVAKFFYILSMACSGTSTVSSSIAVYCNKCGLSKTGMLGDGFGGLFLYAGNRANEFGEVLEGKRKPRGFGFLPRAKVKRPLPKFGGGYRGMSFVSNGANLSNIPYMELIYAGLTIYTTYRCAKFVVKSSKSIYRYVKKKSSPKLNPSHVVWFISEYLIESFSTDRIYKIYYLALQL